MWSIHASIGFKVGEGSTQWDGRKHLPTFFLDESVQGILNAEQAERIARSILDPFDAHIGRIAIMAVKV